MLGPGYDCSDLNRGGILPQERAHIDGFDWNTFFEVGPGSFQLFIDEDPKNEQRRREDRLILLATQVLPNIGALPSNSTIVDAESWLKQHGFFCLWKPQRMCIELSFLKRLFEDAFSISLFFRRYQWRALACSASKLSGGKFVYWDIVRGEKKFGMARPTR
jgi:hypothetical protein